MQRMRALIGCMEPNKTLMITILIFTYQQHNTEANDNLVGISNLFIIPVNSVHTLNYELTDCCLCCISCPSVLRVSVVCMHVCTLSASTVCVRLRILCVRLQSVHNVHLIPPSFSSDMGPDPELFGHIGSGKIVPGLFDEKIWIIFAKFTSQNGPIHL
jgi:hypothetical protein